jgi:DNA-binding beta-propeller fold protein YncE
MPTISFQIRKGEYIIPVPVVSSDDELNVFNLRNFAKSDVVVRSFSVSSQESNYPADIFFRPDGTKMYMVGYLTAKVYSYTLSTPWNISTASYDNVFFSVNSQDTRPYGLFFKPDGTRMYVLGYSSKRVYSYTLSTPWNISTASYDNVFFFL